MNVDKDGAEGKENEAKELKNELSTVKSTINELNAELIKIKKDNAARSEEEANEGSSATSDD